MGDFDKARTVYVFLKMYFFYSFASENIGPFHFPKKMRRWNMRDILDNVGNLYNLLYKLSLDFILKNVAKCYLKKKKTTPTYNYKKHHVTGCSSHTSDGTNDSSVSQYI